ncbi:ArsR/SmtB family transcription factor [Actinomadura hibisca]|uniref:ArsR/SmtB family transcription factor n=1 Tax=Actinomadura hibisca TaxID=68565 RepID=UPI0008296871|nr:metalloregulator ArsR/SmtB family transcription factor [Actinomadura hibisca]
MIESEHTVRLLGALADPLRFAVLRLLARERELPAGAMAEHLRVSAPRLANHLALLRDAELVVSRRVGRAALYRLTDLEAVAALVRSVDALAGNAEAELPGITAFARARTCYDHLAGQLGVVLYERMVAVEALVPGPEAESPLAPGPGLAAELARLGVEAPDAGRRHLAVGCLDSTAGTPHVGGALGAAILHSLRERDLLSAGPADRVLTESPEAEAVLAGRA